MSICAVNARIPGSQNYVRISVKMSESRLSNNISGHLFNNYCFIFYVEFNFTRVSSNARLHSVLNNTLQNE